MNPAKVVRSRVKQLTDLPNIGKASAEDLRVLGIRSPEQLAGKCPFKLYERLCRKTGVCHDPCVIDVFMSVTSFMDGGPARPWWDFTKDRKRRISSTVAVHAGRTGRLFAGAPPTRADATLSPSIHPSTGRRQRRINDVG